MHPSDTVFDSGQHLLASDSALLLHDDGWFTANQETNQVFRLLLNAPEGGIISYTAGVRQHNSCIVFSC